MSISRPWTKGELAYRYLSIAYSTGVVTGASLLAMSILLVKVLQWITPIQGTQSLTWTLFTIFAFISLSDLIAANAIIVRWLAQSEDEEIRARCMQVGLIGLGFTLAPAIYGIILLFVTGDAVPAVLLGIISFLHALISQLLLPRIRALE